MTHSGYARSLFRLGQLCATHQVPLSDPLFLPNESLIARARNYCAHMFLQSDATHFMFIDADIEFDPLDVLSLMSLCDEGTDKDIVCGVYPKKHIAWDKSSSPRRREKQRMSQRRWPSTAATMLSASRTMERTNSANSFQCVRVARAS